MAVYTLTELVVGGVVEFKGLSDVPSTYSGGSGKFLQVKQTEDGLGFITADQAGLLTKLNYTRKKSEAVYSGISVPLPSNTASNIISLLAAQTITSGSLAPFFNVVAGKIRPFNDNANLEVKLNIIGDWTSSSSNRSMELDVVGSLGNKIVENRLQNVTSDTFSFSIPLFVDVGGNLATNGAAITLKPNGEIFTITSAVLIASQVTTLTSI